MLLNPLYYFELVSKYQSIKLLENNLNDKASVLSLKIIVQQLNLKHPIHLNFQSNSLAVRNIAKCLFIELANQIFCNAADFPQLKIGDKVKSKTPMHLGLAKPRYLVFTIESVHHDRYRLHNKQHSLMWEKNYSEIVQKFITVSHNAQNDTLNRFGSFFEKLNGGHVHDFIPTFFERKCIFIAPKTFYDSLEVKNKIPTTYFPNPREETNPHETKSIPALPDSIMYFVTKYKVCYDKILLQGKKIDTIVVFDTEQSELEQVIQDKKKFGFNLIVLTNDVSPIKSNQVPLWNWFKEELQIINEL